MSGNPRNILKLQNKYGLILAFFRSVKAEVEAKGCLASSEQKFAPLMPATLRRNFPISPSQSEQHQEGSDNFQRIVPSPYTGNSVVFFTTRSVNVDCTRETPGSWVRMSVWMRSKSRASRKAIRSR